MDDHHKTKPQLIDELNQLRQRLTVFETAASQHQQPSSLSDQDVHLYWRSLFDNSLNGLILNELALDEAGEPADVIIRAVNSAFERQTGLRAEDMVDKKLSESLPAAYQRGIWREHVPVALTGQPLRIERFSEETYRFYDTFVFCPQPNFFAVTFVDITERKQAEEALRVREAQLRLALKAAGMGIWRWDITTGKVYWSEEMERLIGLGPGAFAGNYDAYIRLIHSDDLPLVNATLAQVISPERGNNDFYTEHRLLRSDGSWCWVQADGQLFRDEAGQPIELIGTAMNITARKAAEEILRQSETRYRTMAEENASLLAQAEKDAQIKTTLLNEVNHRVKNNLMAISALLLIEKRYIPAEGRPFVMAVLNRLDQRIRGLIETHNLLSQTKWSPVSLTELVERVGRGLLQHLPVQKQIKLDISSPPVRISPRQASNLALIINELVTNTVKYALDTPAETANINIVVQPMPEDEAIVLEYRDDGPGYPSEILTPPADVDRSAKAQSRAGLYLIERLAAHALKGTVTLANDHGAVTKIQFYAEDEHTT